MVICLLENTGDLELIENTLLRNIMKMGAKFRETLPCNKRKLTCLYRDAIEKLTKKVARSTKGEIIIFDSWKHSITQEVLKSLPITFESSFIMDRPEVRQYINYLYARFVIVPVDKASNNFGIVCKSFYLNVIKYELGISDDGNIIGNTVYKLIYQKANDIYKFHEHIWYGMELLAILINIYLYSVGRQNNINAHTNSVAPFTNMV